MAVRLLDEMEASYTDDTTTSTLLLPPHVSKPNPDQVTYGTVMAACERSKQWKEVLRFAKKSLMIQKDLNLQMDGIALTSALHACQQLGYADEAIYYLDLMKRLSSSSSSSCNDDDYEHNGENEQKESHRNTRGRQRKGARKPLQGPDEVAYRLAISACARSREEGRYKDGIQLLNEMKKDWNLKPDVVAYTAAIAGCADAGEYQIALELLQRMKEEEVEPNVVTYSAVIGACATASAKAATRIQDDDDDDDTYLVDSSWDDENGNENTDNDDYDKNNEIQKPLQKALQLLSYMKSSQSNVTPNIVTYNAAIRACAEGQDLIGAFELVDELIACGLKPTIVTYGSLMTACERVGSVEAASNVFKRMRTQNDEEEEEEMQPNEIIYGAAISCCRKARQPDRAFLLLRRMIKDGLFPNAATFNTVILAHTEGKKPNLDQAILIYRLMKSQKLAAASSSGSTSFPPSSFSTEFNTTTPIFCKPNRQTYNILIQSLSSNRRPEEAELFLRKMRLEDGFVPDVDLYTVTVTAYERNGQPMKALRLMESMREDGYDFYEAKVLNEAFKKAVKLVNVVGRGFSSKASNTTESSSSSSSSS
uniref:PROP1-like PPR domain-containing protein n=1 Tax=Ditylum brightwellii TaxID=49249 RepID=A0A7S4RPL2_9STRA